MRTVHVSLGNRSYDIKIAPGLLDRLGRECARLKLSARCAIITDTNVGKRYARAVFKSLATAGFSPSLIIVQPGETATTTAASNAGILTLEVPPDAVLYIEAAQETNSIYLSLVTADYAPRVVPKVPFDIPTLPGEDGNQLTPYGPSGTAGPKS